MPPRPPLPDCWALLGSCCVAGRWASWAHQRYSLARGGPFPHQRALPTPGRSTPAYFYPGCRLHSGDARIRRWKSPRHVVLRPSWTVDRGNWLGDSERSLTFPSVHQDYLWSSKWRCEKQFAGSGLLSAHWRHPDNPVPILYHPLSQILLFLMTKTLQFLLINFYLNLDKKHSACCMFFTASPICRIL